MSQTTKEQIRELYADCSDEDIDIITYTRIDSFNKTGEYLSDGEIHNNAYNAVMDTLTPLPKDFVNDMVKSPSHYSFFDTEVIGIIKASMSREQFIGYLKGNAIKYRLRAGKKDNALQDLEKSGEYERMFNEL